MDGDQVWLCVNVASVSNLMCLNVDVRGVIVLVLRCVVVRVVRLLLRVVVSCCILLFGGELLFARARCCLCLCARWVCDCGLEQTPNLQAKSAC